MKEENRMREAKKKLEKDISKLLNDFVKEQGHCDISTHTILTYEDFQNGKSVFLGAKVDCKVTI